MNTNIQVYAPFWLVFGLVLTGLMFFGIAYNWLMERLELHGLQDGFLSMLVAIGVAVTVAGAGVLIGWKNALILLACFAASGLPMMLGSVCRYVRNRRQDQLQARQLAQEALEHDPCRRPGQE